MTADKIMEIALRHFARHGYEGASLADISAEVGIKKPSIYNHFKGKDELFLAVYRDAAARELRYVEDDLNPEDRSSSLKDRLYGFLIGYKERYEREENTKFFLRMSFFPPAHLLQETMSMANDSIDRIAAAVTEVFRPAADDGLIHPDVTVEHATGAYMAVLDSVFVEMLYGDHERTMMRLEAAWQVYWRGVKNN
ncbi:AcrR family transcriptional regulator [Paenibacillus phyllosphaerae]|uniref:AcrR family transcriptional regulator n=1 Tax=Paenibacillus phyllosphaerae TaxID=274593 RepID=A0A7W5FPJ3_9BACL|nr:TetR/AcrR family transcriptional regulator [Paenibacillus phyllosphaerae]MBB3112420.1 AcrR family transcriptional regulator [Paenibacillus phyllosphaerae]